MFVYSMYMSLDTYVWRSKHKPRCCDLYPPLGCLRLGLQLLTTAHTSQLVIFLEFSCVHLLNVGVLELERVLPSPTIHGFRGFGLKASYFTKYIISLPCPTYSHPFFLRQNLSLYWELTGVTRLKCPAGPSNCTDCLPRDFGCTLLFPTLYRSSCLCNKHFPD